MSKTNGHVAKFVLKPGKRDEALKILRPMFDQVEKEPGALLYLMHVDPSDENVIWFYERYVDDAAFEFHSSTPAHDLALKSLLKVLEPSWKVYWLDLEFGKGLGAADTRLGAGSAEGD
jgi:quinol monooxygenase YgiN